jgi:hypothetical protein
VVVRPLPANARETKPARVCEAPLRQTESLASSHYLGIYVLEEKIKIGPHRVDIDELRPENLTAPSVTGGYLLKFDRLDPGGISIPLPRRRPDRGRIQGQPRQPG